MADVMGSLKLEPAQSRPDLLAAPVAKALAVWPDEAPVDVDQIMVAPIDAELADTAAFCEAYGVSPEESANCVIVAGRGGGGTPGGGWVGPGATRAAGGGGGCRPPPVCESRVSPVGWTVWGARAGTRG